MVKRNISFHERKKEIITKTWTLLERKSSCYEFFWIKEAFILWISDSKKRYFSMQEVDRKIFPQHLRGLRDILRAEVSIFTAKSFRIILNGKTLLYSGLSSIFWQRSDGLRIASKIMSRTFRSITQSNNTQSAERENRAQIQSWKQIQFQEEEIKDRKDSYSYHKNQLSCETDSRSIRYLQLVSHKEVKER